MTLTLAESNLLALYSYEARYIGISHITCCPIGKEGLGLYVNLMRGDSLEQWAESLRTGRTRARDTLGVLLNSHSLRELLDHKSVIEELIKTAGELDKNKEMISVRVAKPR